ncbi:MAG TPA: peptide deformylase [Deltaproteobacteria bacterium]|nr:peptide deformylase [Deltaproteobacteria bacterium]
MAVLEIITAPHPVLERPARPVEPDEFGPELAKRVSDMAETMYAAPGVGLAAPQVSDPRRIVVLDPGEPEDRGRRFFALINPKIISRSERMIPWLETCLSVPEFEIEIQRHYQVQLEWQDVADGSTRTGWFEEFEAVIVQHEIDHLQGTILLDRSSRFKRNRYLKKVSKAKKKDQVIA